MTATTTKKNELKVLVCSGNLGNAEPTQASMEAWIPALGACRSVTGGGDDDGFFDLISVGMQESTWKKTTKDGGSAANNAAGAAGAAPVEDEDDLEEDYQKGRLELSPGMIATKVVAGSMLDAGRDAATKAGSVLEVGRDAPDSVALRTMIRRIVGQDYVFLVEQQRGQMRLFILVRKHLRQRFSDVKVKCENTGIGHVLANKGGIVAYLTYQQSTRLCFASAHLAAHEGAAYRAARCDNLREIFQGTVVADPLPGVDATVSAHVLFLCGDLNFRTRFPEDDDGNGMEQEERVQKAMELIQAKDWETLYSYDELQQAIQRGDALTGFQTSPCLFPPTFKVEREAGFVYKKQRTPSYTDRILWKCADGLEKIVTPESYEPCGDFATSDHKPIRGAFSVKPSETVLSVDKLHLVFRGLKGFDLPAMDVDGSSDPYLKFKLVPDHRAEKASKRNLVTGAQSPAWPATGYVAKTLNPVWNEEIDLVVEGKVGADAMLFIMAFDFDTGSKDDLMGTLALNLQELLGSASSEDSSTRTIQMDRPMLKYGKECGRVQFTLEILPFDDRRKVEEKVGVLGRARKMLGLRKQQH